MKADKEEIKKEIECELSRREFWQFCLYMDYEFFDKREKVLKPVAEAMQEIEKGKLELLYVGMPPRTGKSYITSLFTAWLLGRNPTESIMRNTVTQKLYSKFSSDIRDIMQGKTHDSRYLDIFNVSFASDKVDGWKLESSQHGVSYFGSGVGGSIIGFGCTKAAILDDSIKNAEEAMSETILNKKWDWYTSTHKSRMEKGCPEIHIATRWSKNDIPGRLINQELFNDDKAEKIVIPALNEEGNSYCEKIHSTEKLHKDKKLLDDVIWQAEWQQNPIEAKGLLFPTDSLNKFDLENLKGEPDAIISFCDTADEGTDFLSNPIAYQYGQDLYIVDIVFTQEDVSVTEPLVAEKNINNNVEKLKVESNNGGKYFANDVERIIKKENYYCDVVTQSENRNKETRILMQSGYIKEHFYFLEDYELGSQYSKFMEQITTYSKQGKNKHDDAPDSLVGLADMVRGRTTNDFNIDSNFGTKSSAWRMK